MDALGINGTLLLFQIIPLLLLIGLPVIALMDIAKKKMSGTPLAVWALIICGIPLLGVLAYWIVKPAASENQ